ncbi:hypothetical protein B0I37DRAFT_93418 [Chaetomium sp. MPI-CAGE-AT-0009]|nr:hypothetical protein B0I37DRAFT_93418 [Chaetomium sp. MPI-CAGE-AT-0009]
MLCPANFHYPSGPWRDRFFRIGATGPDDTVFHLNPDNDDITYVLPGVDVVLDHAGSISFDAQSISSIPEVKFHATGADVATALAAGLAAMIIYCVKASILAAKTAGYDGVSVGEIPDNAAELIAHADEMKRAFASLGRVTPSKFVQIWEELDKMAKNLENWRTLGLIEEVKMDYVLDFIEFGQKLWTAASRED